MLSLSKNIGSITAVLTIALLLAACGPDTPGAPSNSSPVDPSTAQGSIHLTIGGKSVNAVCSGGPTSGKPVVVLLPGLGDGLDKMGSFQAGLGATGRTCSYDRLGEGASDQPDRTQDLNGAGQVLTEVIDRLAGPEPVVLVGHSLGGLIAARYAPDHQDKVRGLVLLDATGPNSGADTMRIIPAAATGPAAELRAEVAATSRGENPEKLVVPDGGVRSAGDIPVEVIEHGKPYIAAAVPTYGQALEQSWTRGEHEWLALSSNSTIMTASLSDHYIYLDQPDVALQAVARVTAQVHAT